MGLVYGGAQNAVVAINQPIVVAAKLWLQQDIIQICGGSIMN